MFENVADLNDILVIQDRDALHKYVLDLYFLDGFNNVFFPSHHNSLPKGVPIAEDIELQK